MSKQARPNDDLARIVRRQSIAFLIISIIASVLVLVIGFFLGSDGIYGSVLTALGGGALGAALGIALSGFLDASPLSQIQRLLAHTLHSHVFSDEESINSYRKVWHHYILTKSGGSEIWRYRKYDFSVFKVPGKVIATLNVPKPSGDGFVQYALEGYLVGTRFILVQKPAGGAEPPIVQVFPNAGEQFRNSHSGFGILKTWDGDQLLFPSILSSAPLIKAAEGTVEQSDCATLNDHWKADFLAGQKIASLILSQ